MKTNSISIDADKLYKQIGVNLIESEISAACVSQLEERLQAMVTNQVLAECLLAAAKQQTHPKRIRKQKETGEPVQTNAVTPVIATPATSRKENGHE